MFGINGWEFLIIAIVAFMFIGPEKLPELAAQLRRLTKEAKRIATGARERVKDELGPELSDLDLSDFDFTQYDPRRIVREALQEESETTAPRRPREQVNPGAVAAAVAGAQNTDSPTSQAQSQQAQNSQAQTSQVIPPQGTQTDGEEAAPVAAPEVPIEDTVEDAPGGPVVGGATLAALGLSPQPEQQAQTGDVVTGENRTKENSAKENSSKESGGPRSEAATPAGDMPPVILD